MAALALALEPWTALRALAWALAVGVGLWAYARRPDAAGRAFALFAVVWAGGVQLLLTLQAMAADAASAQLLFRGAYYATLFTSAAFLPLLLYVPARPGQRALPLLAAILCAGVLVLAAFALDHGAFLQEQVVPGAAAGGAAAYVPENVGLAEVAYHPLIWTGFLAGMAWLGWRFPSWPAHLRGSAAWLMAGLALFAADRFARTAAQALVAPAGLDGGLELALYFSYQMAFGLGLAWMAWRSRGLPEGRPVRAFLAAGLLVGATGLLTWNLDLGIPGGVPVLLSALLGPAYLAVMARGVAAAEREDVAYARDRRGALLAES